MEECACQRRSRETGRVDYAIQVAGQWVPVETKLSVRAELDLLGQVKKYVGISGFVPTQGRRRGLAVATARARSLCLVIDREGVYPVVNGRFAAGCGPERPMWKRTRLSDTTIRDIRNWIVAQG